MASSMNVPYLATRAAKIELSLVITLLITSWTTVSLRMWGRIRITKTPGWDDAMMVLTLILFTFYCSFIVVVIAGGGFSQFSTVKSLKKTLIYIQLGEVFYVLTTTSLKISLGLFFLRVLTKPWQKRIFQTLIWVSALYGIFYMFIAIFQCGLPGQVLSSILKGRLKCLPTKFLFATGYLYGIICVVADWTFVLIPIFILVESDMDRRSKISVSIIMVLGAVGSVSAIMRMVYVRGLLLNGEYISDSANAAIWATAEPGTGITAASLATLRPLFRKLREGMRSKISTISASSASGFSRSKVSTAGKDWDYLGQNDMIGLTTAVTGGTHNTAAEEHSKKMSMESNHSYIGDPWDDHVTLERAEVATVKHVRMHTGFRSPQRV
ncbi:hypothetical protein BCR34DRAFT_267352 [Clohesyomyces aquaticus]|uniref:Rhodopsin domain-containing protein n=1 Tax=Clohesyomyces aquaticus TaxID=1231657 RepID=A0A1Y1ZSY8_9PLEO|nr:hypothetical protein BCR34DRAFT_267352 [Clohesyomyces aquaticus]